MQPAQRKRSHDRSGRKSVISYRNIRKYLALLLYWVVVRSFAAALCGRVVGWGKLERRATVEVPS